jgi:Tetratricopeptide repeat
MSRRKTVCIGLAILVLMAGRAEAQHGGSHHGAWHGWHGGGGHGNAGPQVFGLGAAGFYGGFYGGYYPMLAMGPGGFMPPVGWLGPPFIPGPGPLLPPPPQGIPGMDRNVKRTNLKASDPARSEQLAILGDRLFRAGNFKRAEERYLQAIRAAPDLAKPRFRLAQIAMMRGQYDIAATRVREAETAQPGWIINAPDIQALYGEPVDFANNVARLETHLQTNPDDRDAWLVLGAEWFLSGRTTKAADVFKRLNDPNRKPDVALTAFLDASNQTELRAGKPPIANPPIR